MTAGALGVLVAVVVLGLAAPRAAAGTLVRARLAGLHDAVPAARSAAVPVDATVVLELLGAALRAGAGVPRALDAVGAAVGGPDGEALAAAGRALVLGARWDEAWRAAPGRLEPVGRALRPTWQHGAAPGEALRVAADQLHRDRRAAARSAAGRLAVRLVLPLGTCFLPAFVLVGLLPVLLALGLDLLAR